MRPAVFLDLECFSNWFLVGITSFDPMIEWDYQLYDGHALDTAAICSILQQFTVVTFNGNNYDIPMLLLALQGADCAALKQANDDIIVNRMRPWQFAKKYGTWTPEWLDHVDIMETTPGVRIGLKAYGCRGGAESIEDSPSDFTKPLDFAKVPEVIGYCRNDRRLTKLVFDAVRPSIEMREKMGAKYGVDLRSKSDAQMAEAMVKAEWQRRMKDAIAANASGLPVYDTNWYGEPKVAIPRLPHGSTFKAIIPEYISFVSPDLQELLQVVKNIDFLISDKEQAIQLGFDGEKIKTGVVMPKELSGKKIRIGQTLYSMGIGGLHSNEKSVTHRSIPGVQTLVTRDVRSYYPSLIINSGLFPSQLGKFFQDIFKDFYDWRLDAKAAMKKLIADTPEWLEKEVIANGGKIVLNGTFGKLFSLFSIFFSPQQGISTTVGGQLSLLMLIERLEMAGIQVVSANTDGVETLVPYGKEWVADSIVSWWEDVTELGMDQEAYLSLHSRDVNNYISVHFDGSTKRKGIFAKSGIMEKSTPDMDICSDAISAWLSAGVPIEKTILECRDIRKFVRCRSAKGGAAYVSADGHVGVPLGRAVRWYYGMTDAPHLIDVTSGNKIAGTSGAILANKLPCTFPDDVNFHHYIATACNMLETIGAPYGKEYH